MLRSYRWKLSLVDDGILTVEAAAEKAAENLGDRKDFFVEKLKKRDRK